MPPDQVEDITKVAKERVDLAKALIRASEKAAKPKKAKAGEGADKVAGNEGSSPATGGSGETTA